MSLKPCGPYFIYAAYFLSIHVRGKFFKNGIRSANMLYMNIIATEIPPLGPDSDIYCSYSYCNILLYRTTFEIGQKTTSQGIKANPLNKFHNLFWRYDISCLTLGLKCCFCSHWYSPMSTTGRLGIL